MLLVNIMLSIKNNSKYEYIIKNSKFISLIFRVYNKDEVNNYLDKVKNEYEDKLYLTATKNFKR